MWASSKKRIVRKWLLEIATGILGSCVYRTAILLWLITLVCTVTYYESVVHPGVSETRYVPYTEKGEPQFWTQPLDDRLVDLDDFIMTSYQDCGGTSFLIALVASAPRNKYNRYVIRSTWGKAIRVLFLLGESEEFASDLNSESDFYGDLIRGNFIDDYNNMTYKHVMGLKWISMNCPEVKYVLKVDDDVFVNVPSLMDWLIQISPYGTEKLIACQMETQRAVHRHPESKWYVSEEEYSKTFYPEFCRGWAIIYSRDVVQTLYMASYHVNYFWIDDVYVTGFLAERVGLRITRLYNLTLTHDRVPFSIMLNNYKQPFLFYLTSPKKFAALQTSLIEDISTY